LPPGQPDQVNLLLERAIRAGLVPGAVAVWGRPDGQRQKAVVGDAALVPVRRRLSEDAWFDLASLTKPLVTTTLTLIALRDPGLGLSTTVGEVLDRARPGPLAEVTLQQLLTHTSGLPAWAPVFTWSENSPEIRSRLLEMTPEFRPGARVTYSCLGFLVLAEVVIELLQRPLDVAFREHVLTPLGLDDEAGFHPNPDKRPIVAGALTAAAERPLLAEHNLDPDLIPTITIGQPDDGNARSLGGVGGNSGLFGTVNGVLVLASQYLADSSRLLTTSEIEMATTCHTAGGEQHRGLGWQIANSPGCSAGTGLSPSSFGHVGFTGTSVWIDPARDAVYILLSHRNHPTHRNLDIHPLRRRFHQLATCW
jgi:CubicO group peptidase (beta-lactamase class C family)